MTWIDVNTWFNRFDALNQRDSDRLHKLEPLMQDFPGRRQSQSVGAAAGMFVSLPGTKRGRPVDPDQFDDYREMARKGFTLVSGDRDGGRERAGFENRGRFASDNKDVQASMQAAEKLRVSFHPRRPRKRLVTRHDPRPVPAALVAWGRALGVHISDS